MLARTTTTTTIVVVVAAWLAGLGLSVSASTAAGTVAEPVDAGDVEVVMPSNSTRPLAGGGSATPFTLRLPEGAVCPGDSANDNWRIQTFILDLHVVPGDVQYELAAPQGGYGLYGVDTRPYMQRLTYANTEPGQPGLIPPIDPLSFAVFPPGTLAPGTYRIGVACTYFRETAKYWDTQIQMAADSRDSPAQLTWTVPTREPTPVQRSQENWWLPVAAGVAALAVLTLIARQRATRRARVTKKEFA